MKVPSAALIRTAEEVLERGLPHRTKPYLHKEKPRPTRVDVLDRAGHIVASTAGSSYPQRYVRQLQACPGCELLVEVGGPHRCERAA